MRMNDARSWCPSANKLHWVLALSAAAFLGACNDSSQNRAPSPPPPPPPGDLIPLVSSYPPSLQPLQGHFFGYVTIGDVPHFADALITVDGFVRIYVDGSSQNPIVDSVQFVGRVVADASQASGTGMIVGQGCALASGRFCAETASAEISTTLNADDGSLSGEILVATSTGDETWQLNMAWPDARYTAYGYLEPATLAWAEGQYYIELTEFAVGNTLINVDAAGGVFFQSPSSGCVGNGMLAPHLDGAFNVYDVTLTLELCSGAYAYLNGKFEGLATIHVSCPDDDCTGLTFFLASVEGAVSRTAVTISAIL